MYDLSERLGQVYRTVLNLLNFALYAPFLAQLVVTRRCNLTCGYCNEYDSFSQPVPASVLEQRLCNLKRLGTLTVEFTGGEPLLHPKISDLIAIAKRMGFMRVMMISNAFRLSQAQIQAFNDAGLDHMQISVDGVTPNAVTIKVLKSLRARLRLLSKEAKFKVTISAVIGSAADEEALEVVHFARSLGFKPRVLLIHGPDGQLALSPKQLSFFHQVQKAIGDNASEAGDYRTRLAEGKKAPFKCRAGSRYLYIDETGLVSWCSQTRDQFAKALNEYSVQDLREQFHTAKSCNTHCTVGCVRTNSKVDEWRPQNA